MAQTDKKILKRFGENFREVRLSKKLSQRQLASQCRVEYSNISKLENGKLNISLITLADLAEGLGVHPKKLWDFEV